MPPFETWNGFKDIDSPLADWEPSPDPLSIEIPGLDTSASINDQIDQMDQLITIKLQNIDANFQKVQEIMTTRILPAFRRYAESTEPVREAARFWISFYEAAAKTSIPLSQDVSVSRDESSAAISQRDTTTDTLDIVEGSPTMFATSTPSVASRGEGIGPPRSQIKDKSGALTRLSLPPATPGRRNPFVPPGTSSSKWDGIVDLTNSPGVPRFSPHKLSEEESTTFDTSDDWPPGISPLQTIKFDLPGVPQLSPRKPKDASRKIVDDLLARIATSRSARYTDSSTQSPPNLSFTSTSATLSPPSLSGLRWHNDAHNESRSLLSSHPPVESLRAEVRDASTPQAEEQPQIPTGRLIDTTLSASHDDDDSFEEDDGTVSNAFKFFAQKAEQSNSGSDSDSDDGTLHPNHFAQIPIVEGDDSFDDSFDLDPGNTDTATNLFAPKGSDNTDFQLKGQDLLDDTLGIGQVLAARNGGHASVDSPTPFGT